MTQTALFLTTLTTPDIGGWTIHRVPSASVTGESPDRALITQATELTVYGGVGCHLSIPVRTPDTVWVMGHSTRVCLLYTPTTSVVLASVDLSSSLCRW